MDGELEYYAALSGLTPANEFSLMDHARAAGISPIDYSYWSGESGLGDGFSLADHKRAAIAAA